MSHTFALGLQLMLYGLTGVFTTLIVFILSIVALTRLFPARELQEENEE